MHDPFVKFDPGSQTGIFVAIANSALYGSKIIDFSFMPKIIRIFSKDHVP